LKLFPWTKEAAPTLPVHLTSKQAYNRWLTENHVQFQVEVPPEMLQGMTFGGTLAPRISRNEALQVPAVLQGRNLICSTLSSLPLHFYDSSRNQVEDALTLRTPFNLNVPNVVTLSETFEDLLFFGVSWWRVTQFHSGVFPLKPMHAEHVPQETVFEDEATGRIYIDGVPVPTDEIIRFDSPNPPLLVHAARAIRTCLRLDRTAANYADVPIPLNIFSPNEGAEELSEEEVDDLLNRWFLARQQRTDAYLPSSIKLDKMSWTATDIQLHEQRQHAVLEIARAFNIDPEDFGISTTSRTYQNAESRNLAFLQKTLMPYVQAVEQRLSMNDVSPRGYYAKIVMDAFLRSDTKTRYDAYKVGKEVGAVTTDEIRELEDRPRLTAAEKEQIDPKPMQPRLQPVNQNGNTPREVAVGR
jgi:hypothetical protein